MAKRKYHNSKDFFIGAAIMIIVWLLGVFASGRIPYFIDYLSVSNGNTALSKAYPFLLVVFFIVFAVACKRKSKNKVFFGSYLLLFIPSASFLFFQIYSLLNFDFLDYVGFLWLPFVVLAVPAISVFDGFFIAVYGNTRPVGFSDAHLAFCILMPVAVVLPPIIYKLVKVK